MPRPREPLSCSLLVIVPGPTRSGPDAAPLAHALGHRLGSATVAVWADDGHVDHATAMHAADVLDQLRDGAGLRADYVETCGDLRDAVAALVRQRPAPVVIAVASSTQRRTRSAIRRAAAQCGAHVALVPAHGSEAHVSVRELL